jgi:predicted tellurium resistance membrane protein TerC
MYPNVLISILILLMAVEVIGGMLNNHKLIKAAGVGVVLLVAGALIIWVMMGLSPVPVWAVKFVTKIVRSVAASVAAIKS